ncbi:hypothetical protein G5I_03371 [Acromyrmex echinatior]|uniref:Uncharacterized protein n=1 Tax=Acromyrmex echinatior TaxID=103372 RepID=F4WCT9_ACREC|nr:hypothetical protein G5I_03371 [Acromyrmex echinatior]
MASDSSGRTNHSPRSVSSSLHSPILVYNPHEPVNSIPSTMDSKAPENLSDSQCDILNLPRDIKRIPQFQSSPMDIDEIINSRKRPSSDRDVSQDSPLVTPPPRKNLLRLFPHLQIHKDRNNNNNRAKASKFPESPDDIFPPCPILFLNSASYGRYEGLRSILLIIPHEARPPSDGNSSNLPGCGANKKEEDRIDPPLRILLRNFVCGNP